MEGLPQATRLSGFAFNQDCVVSLVGRLTLPQLSRRACVVEQTNFSERSRAVFSQIQSTRPYSTFLYLIHFKLFSRSFPRSGPLPILFPSSLLFALILKTYYILPSFPPIWPAPFLNDFSTYIYAQRRISFSNSTEILKILGYSLAGTT